MCTAVIIVDVQYQTSLFNVTFIRLYLPQLVQHIHPVPHCASISFFPCESEFSTLRLGNDGVFAWPSSWEEDEDAQLMDVPSLWPSNTRRA